MVARFGELLAAQRARKTRKLVLLGASGSIGASTLRCLRRRSEFKLNAVSVHRSVDRLAAILKEFQPRFAAISDDAIDVARLRTDYPRTQFFQGAAGLLEMLTAAAEDGADTVLTAVVGAAGIRATIRAIELGLKVALANKETLVTAGPVLQRMLQLRLHDASGACIIPVDSEHSAAFQLLEILPARRLRRLLLTGSGGPFRDLSPEQIQQVTREQALRHPTWNMGPKITVDSAGMINKGLELIEAHFLFSIPYSQIGAVVHRKSLVHAIAETADGSYMMAASQPDMVFPIQFALDYPEASSDPLPESTPPTAWSELHFEEVAIDRYPGFALCLQAGQHGGAAPAVLNAANEAAVELLLADRIRFAEIPQIIARALERLVDLPGEQLEELLEADRQARVLVGQLASALR